MQVPYFEKEVGDFLFRPAGTNEFPLLVPPLARWSRAANTALGIYDDEDGLKGRAAWQQLVVRRMHDKGWSVDLRQWTTHQSLLWLCTVSALVSGAAWLSFGSAGAVLSSMALLCLVSIGVGVFELLRH